MVSCLFYPSLEFSVTYNKTLSLKKIFSRFHVCTGAGAFMDATPLLGEWLRNSQKRETATA